MRIFYPLEGPGCRVVVSQGFIEGFCDDHTNCQLVGLQGVTFFLDEHFQLVNIHFRNGNLKQWQGAHLGMLLAMAQEKAEEERPPKTSGFRPAVKVPEEVKGEPLKPATPHSFVPPIPREDPPEPSKPPLEYIPGKFVVRRKSSEFALDLKKAGKK